MDTLDLDVIRSLRGSMARDSIFLSTADRKRAYVSQLADDAGVDLRTARGAIFGEVPRFAPELSLVSLGLIRPLDEKGREFEITRYGDESARLRRQVSDRRKL